MWLGEFGFAGALQPAPWQAEDACSLLSECFGPELQLGNPATHGQAM